MAQDNNKKSDWDALQDVLDKEAQEALDSIVDSRQEKTKNPKRAKKVVKEKQGKADERKSAQTRKKARIPQDAAAIIGRSLGFVDPTEKVALALASESPIKDSLDDGKMTAVVAMAKKTKRTTAEKVESMTGATDLNDSKDDKKAEEVAKPVKKKRRVKTANPEEEKATEKAFSALLAQIDNVAAETVGGKRRAKSVKREKTTRAERKDDDATTENVEQTTTTIPAPETTAEPPIVVEPSAEALSDEFVSSVVPEPVDEPFTPRLPTELEVELALAANSEPIPTDDVLVAEGSVVRTDDVSSEPTRLVQCFFPQKPALWIPDEPSESQEQVNPFEKCADAPKANWDAIADGLAQNREDARNDFDALLAQRATARQNEALEEAPIGEEQREEPCEEQAQAQAQDSFDFGEFGGDFWNVEDSIDVQWGRAPNKEATEDEEVEAAACESCEADGELEEDELDDEYECDEIELVQESEEETREPAPAPVIDLDSNPEAFFAFGVEDEENLCFTPREKKEPPVKAPVEQEAQRVERDAEEKKPRTAKKRRNDVETSDEWELEPPKSEERHVELEREPQTVDEPIDKGARERRRQRREREPERADARERETRDERKERRARELDEVETIRERRERRREERDELFEEPSERRPARRRELDEEPERAVRAKKRPEEERERTRAQESARAAAQREERILPTWDEALSYVVNFNLARRNQRNGRAK